VTDESVLSMWTVYDHPSDFPHCYVARRHAIVQGQSVATTQVMVSNELRALQGMLRGMGLVKLARDPDDDPVIVEVWL